MKVVAIIQARMGSTRLPGKMMMNLAGKPVIQHVFERVEKAEMIDEIWLATTITKDDDILAKWAKKNQIKRYRGSVNDVLDRYYQTALLAKADAVIRITGDCPLIDPQIIDQIISEFTKGGFDYVCNQQPPTFPDGLDTEVFSMATLKKTWQEARLKSDREHVTSYIWQHPDEFKLKSVTHVPDMSGHRWTLDTKEDFDLIEKIIFECQKRKSKCYLNSVLSIIKNHSDWADINSKYQRNEGYQKSLKEDKFS